MKAVRIFFGCAITLSLLIGCQNFLAPNNDGGDEPGQQLPDAPGPLPAGVINQPPAADLVFPADGQEVALGELVLIWNATDPNGTNLDTTIFVSDEPAIFDAPIFTQTVRTLADEDEHRFTVQFADEGTYFWGIEITDGVNTIRRPAAGDGSSFTASADFTGRVGIDDALLLCPEEGSPAITRPTFEWSLGGLAAARTQLYIGRGAGDNPFEAPLGLFEIDPPTAESFPLPAGSALTVGEEYSWGLRVETESGVQFTLGGDSGVPFTVQQNIQPTGSLLGPPNGSILADNTEQFLLSWLVDSGNCGEPLTSTVVFAPLGDDGSPINLFGSPLRVDLGVGASELSLIAAQDVDFGAGGWGWGVIADDGTDAVTLTNSDTGFDFRTFFRDPAPEFVELPTLITDSCAPGGTLRDAVAFSFADANGAETVSVTLSFAATEADVFENPIATLVVPVEAVGDVDVSQVVFLQTFGVSDCPAFTFGAGVYGIELNDAVNAPVRAMFAYDDEPTGACCDGLSCVEGFEDDCVGVFAGDGSTCGTIDCGDFVGACCRFDGTCEIAGEAECGDGTYLGNGTNCEDAECTAITGACCLDSGGCTITVKGSCPGEYQGDGLTCSDVNCSGGGPDITDCNLNGIDDGVEISEGLAPDCDTNGIPDVCEDGFINRIYVDGDATGAATGANWPNAFPELRDALAYAEAVDFEGQIWIAEGVYTPASSNGNQAASFRLLENVSILGGFSGEELCLEERTPGEFPTVLSGDLNGDDIDGPTEENSYQVVFAPAGVTATAILDGVTVTAGLAVDSAADSGAGIFCEGSPTISNTTVTGNDAMGSGGGVFITGSPQLLNVVIQGNSGSDGGGLYLSGVDLDLVGLRISDNTATAGGGLYVNAGTVGLSSVTLQNNSSFGPGGGVYAVNSVITLTGSLADGNAAQTDGGAMYATGGTPEINDCGFVGNSSGRSGGAVYTTNAPTAVRSSTFTGNRADANGGAAALDDYAGSIVLSDVQFDANTCGLATGTEGSFYGGGLSLADVMQADLTNVDFAENVNANGNGGGIALRNANSNGAASLTECVLASNQTDGRGGAASLLNVNATFTDCRLETNLSASSGGGIMADFSDLTLNRTTLAGNTASSGVGGGLRETQSSITIVDCDIDSNLANGSGFSSGSGGGLAFSGSGQKTLTTSRITNNAAGSSGGGVHAQSAAISVDRCEIGGNSAVNNGGGVYSLNGQATVVSSLIHGNTSAGDGSDGGGLYLGGDGSDEESVIVNTTIVDNESNGETGGLAVTNGTSARVTNSILWNNLANNEGGLVAQITVGDAVSVSYSAIEDWEPDSLPGEGNTALDPRFVASDDFHLAADSPLIDAGDNRALPANALFDLDGEARRQDDPMVIDTGVGPAPVVDIGAFEDIGDSTIIYVNSSATGNNDGATWADAFTDLQDALSEAATNGVPEMIWVAAGTYTPVPAGPGAERFISFEMVHGTSLYGGFAGSEVSLDDRDPEAFPTILSGDILGNDADSNGIAENSYNVVRALAVSALIDGFVIERGYENQGEGGEGAGIIALESSLTIRNCIIRLNYATTSGGGLYASASTIRAERTRFVSNVADFSGGAADLRGAPAEFISCSFETNAVLFGDGGGLRIRNDAAVRMTNCLVAGNIAFGDGSDGGGLAVDFQDEPVELTNCTIGDNTASNDGGGIFMSIGSDIQVHNTVLWGNRGCCGSIEAQQISANGTTVNITYSLIEGLEDLFLDPTNTGGDPLFESPEYTLGAGSAAIDAGDNIFLPWVISMDLAGRDRRTDDPATPDTGAGSPPIVDMGAFEYVVP